METSITRRRRNELVIGALLLVALALLPLPIHDVYTRNLIIITVLFAGLAQAWNILGGYCGQISLSHALYFGVGAYVSTLLLTRAGIPPTLGMFAGGALGGLMALLVGWPCFRLSGHYYAIATVVVGEIGYLLCAQLGLGRRRHRHQHPLSSARSAIPGCGCSSASTSCRITTRHSPSPLLHGWWPG